jgi:hypothetical protein
MTLKVNPVFSKQKIRSLKVELGPATENITPIVKLSCCKIPNIINMQNRNKMLEMVE